MTRNSRRSIKIEEAVSRFLHPSDLCCCQSEVLVAIVLVHNHILGAYVIRDWRGGRGALKMIRVLHGGVQEMITVYHDSGGSTRGISSPQI